MGNKISKQAELWGEEKLVNSHNEEKMTVDTATDKVIRSGFEEEIVGKMLMKLVEQKDAIEKSIAFAAIIAKANANHHVGVNFAGCECVHLVISRDCS